MFSIHTLSYYHYLLCALMVSCWNPRTQSKGRENPHGQDNSPTYHPSHCRGKFRGKFRGSNQPKHGSFWTVGGKTTWSDPGLPDSCCEVTVLTTYSLCVR